MRKTAKRLGLLFVSLLATIVLGVGAVFTSSFAFGAVALIVPGTGTPKAEDVDNYMQQAQKRYLQGTACTDAASCKLVGIDYPASFWPLVIFPNWCRSGPDGCDKWDVSVGKGTDELQKELEYYLNNTSEPIVVFGYSQGGAVVSNVLSGYIDTKLTAAQKARIQIVTIGGIQTPDGGLWSRLGFLPHIPILDVTLTPAMKPDTGVNFTSYAFHFDPVADAPRYWGNPFALLNAVAALETVHGYYLTPNGNGPKETLPYGYTDETLAEQLDCTTHKENCRTDKYGNKYVVVPATSLPIADLVYQLTPAALRPLVKPFIELVAPAFRVLAELGYDYSGDPSVSTPLNLYPFNPLTFNPISFALKMIGAVIQGVVNAFGGGTSLSPLNPPETAKVTTVNPLNRLAVDPDQVGKLAVDQDKGLGQDKLVEGQKDGEITALAGEQSEAEDGSGVESNTANQNTVDQDAAAKAAAAKLAADKLAADQAAAAKLAADKLAADQAAAAKLAADKLAADQAAAAKLAADKAAADKAAADQEAADQAAAAKEAAEKAREAAAKEAAAKEAADMKAAAKEAAEKARNTAAANNGAPTQASADPTQNDPTGHDPDAGESENKAA